jgi:hypothetical protein
MMVSWSSDLEHQLAFPQIGQGSFRVTSAHPFRDLAWVGSCAFELDSI